MTYYKVQYSDRDTGEVHSYKSMSLTSAMQVLRVLAQDGFTVSLRQATPGELQELDRLLYSS
jgi:hypothetical protein